MKNGNRRMETIGNRFLLIEQNLKKKYYPHDMPPKEPASPDAGEVPVSLEGASPPDATLSTGQTKIVRAFACDDGGRIDLHYDEQHVFDRQRANGQNRSSSTEGQGLPYQFESFSDSDKREPNGAPNLRYEPLPTSNVNQPAKAKPNQVNQTPAPRRPQQVTVPESRSGSQPASSTPDWNALDQVAQRNLTPSEDTFVSDLQTLLTEARRRADSGQGMPAVSPTIAAQNVVPESTTPNAVQHVPAPTAASLAAQQQTTGTDNPSNRHALFDQLGQQMPRAVTFDMGTMSVDKTFAALEASLDAERHPPRKTKPFQAKPLSPIEAVEDMALMTTPQRRYIHDTLPSSLAVEAYMLSSDIPLDPGIGGRSIPVSTLEVGDLLVSTTKDWISNKIRKVTQSPVSHAILYIGDGQVVEAIGEGIVLRSIEEAIAHSYLVVAFRYPGLTQEQGLQIRDYAGQQLGKGYNYTGILRQAGFQLDKRVYCSDKSGEEYDRCIRWIGRVNMGTATNDRFFCSELILKAYEVAGVPLTTTPPNYTSPGDIPELVQKGMLAYVGHLKFQPQAGE